MRRMLLASIGMALAAVLVLALPAGAKGMASARFTGPGLPPGGITIRGGPQDGSNAMLFLTAIFGSKTAGPWTFGQDRSDLGAPYRIIVAPDWAPTSHVAAIVYPYAHGGPWMYTPPGQNVGPGTEMVRGGWWQVGHRMIGSFSYRMGHQFLRFLVRHGFPATAPAYAASDAPLPGQPVAVHRQPLAASTAPDASNAWPVWAWILIAIGMAGALLLIADRQRRRVAA
jgi:hypothetical protein